MPGPEWLLLAYGPVPGVEFLPYFFGLLAWIGLAFAALLWSPIAALLRRLRRSRNGPPAEPNHEPNAPDQVRR